MKNISLKVVIPRLNHTLTLDRGYYPSLSTTLDASITHTHYYQIENNVLGMKKGVI